MTAALAPSTLPEPAAIMPHLGPGAGLARLHQFAEAMGDGPERDTSEHWRIFTEEFFTSSASMHLVLWNPSSRERKAFELPIAVVPRWFHTNYTSGVRSMSFYFENPREYTAGMGYPPIPRIYKMDLNVPSNNVTHFVECKRAMLVLRFETGWQVQMTGLLRASFAPQVRPVPQQLNGQRADPPAGPEAQAQLKLEGLDYIVNHHASFLTRQAITPTPVEEYIPQQLAKRIADGLAGTNGAIKTEPISDGGKANTDNGSDGSVANAMSEYKMPVQKLVVPECPVNEYGITLRVMRCLEITESVCQLRDLIDFTLRDVNPAGKIGDSSDPNQSNRLSPIDGIRRLAAQYRDTARQQSDAWTHAPQTAGHRRNGGAGTPSSDVQSTAANGGAASGKKRKNTITQSPVATPRLGVGTPHPAASPSPNLGSPTKRVR